MMRAELLRKNDAEFIFNNVKGTICDITKEIMTQNFGENWEKSSKARLPSDILSSLLQRKTKFELDSGLKETSNLIDFAEFPEIIKIINSHRALFDKIFSSSATQHDFLTKLADITDEEIDKMTLKEQKRLIGTSWLILKRIQDWRSGGEPKILWYSVDLTFDSHDNPNDCIEGAKKWFSRVEKEAKEGSEAMHPNLGRVYRLEFDKGSAFITNPVSSSAPLGKKRIISSRIRVMTQSTEILDQVLSLGRHSYWSLSWTINDGQDLKSLTNIITCLYDPEGERGNNFVNWGGVEYTLFDNPHILFNIMPMCDNEYRVRVLKRHSYFDNGFYSAHKFISPRIMFEMILGLISENDLRKIIIHSLESQIIAS